jgi:hypothetical protein
MSISTLKRENIEGNCLAVTQDNSNTFHPRQQSKTFKLKREEERVRTKTIDVVSHIN